MSTLIVEVCEIKNIEHHLEADRLDTAIVKGWQVVVKRDEYVDGDKVVYFPPDTLLPEKWTDEFGVSNYCSKRADGMQIRQARLRGEPSFGLVVRVPDESWEIGKDVADIFGAKKYEPPIRTSSGDVLCKTHPLFPRYVDIENLQNFVDIFDEGEEVIATEKCDGTNVRFGLIEGEWMAGSRELIRKKPDTEEEMKRHLYWLPYCIDTVKNMVEYLSKTYKIAIVYGETYGKVQALTYGIPGKIAFAAFDIYVDGKWLDYDEFYQLCTKFAVPVVPLIYRGPFSIEAIKKASEGKTQISGEHIKEGVVVKPIKERNHPKIGRVILKWKSTAYLLSKHHKKDTTDI